MINGSGWPTAIAAGVRLRLVGAIDETPLAIL
jgi:hypothetical protein